MNVQKCFLYTESYYFGTAPDPLPISMQDGDVIALVSGVNLPLVLRPVDGGYRLINLVETLRIVLRRRITGEPR
jgi:hypothetical protein